MSPPPPPPPPPRPVFHLGPNISGGRHQATEAGPKNVLLTRLSTPVVWKFCFARVTHAGRPPVTQALVSKRSDCPSGKCRPRPRDGRIAGPARNRSPGLVRGACPRRADPAERRPRGLRGERRCCDALSCRGDRPQTRSFLLPGRHEDAGMEFPISAATAAIPAQHGEISARAQAAVLPAPNRPSVRGNGTSLPCCSSQSFRAKLRIASGQLIVGRSNASRISRWQARSR